MIAVNQSTGVGSLQDRVIAVTGGAGAIGSAIVARLAHEGARVACLDRDLGAARSAVSKLDRAVGFSMDVTDEGAVSDSFDQVQAHLGPLYGLVNCAGALIIGPLVDTPLDRWRRQIDVNLTGTFICTQAAAKRILAAGTQGSIVNITSAAATRTFLDHAAYCASKAGVAHFSRVAARELGSSGITVNNVAPGPTESPMIADLKADAANYEMWLANMPTGRISQPDDIASAVAWLLGTEARQITGITLNVDGGYVAS